MKTIPQFPDSKKLTTKNKVEIESFVKKFAPYSDFNFTSLYCYNTDDRVDVSWLNGNLVVLFQDYITDDLFYSFLGENQVTETTLILLEHSSNVGIKSELKLIPECTRLILNDHNIFSINEDCDSHDYILCIDSISTLQAEGFGNKRHDVRRLIKIHANRTTKILDINLESTKTQLLDLFFAWQKGKGGPMENAEHELKALNRLLENSIHFDVIAIGVFIQERLIEFTISERLNKEYAIVHFEKHDFAIKGASTYGVQELAKHLKQSGCVYLNYEQDLGLPGLRQMKRQFRPIKYLLKYKITKL